MNQENTESNQPLVSSAGSVAPELKLTCYYCERERSYEQLSFERLLDRKITPFKMATVQVCRDVLDCVGEMATLSS